MKHFKHFALTVLVALVSNISAFAYDFSAKNAAGETIYYDIVSETEKTCRVTFKNSSSYNSYYSINLVIPLTVENKGVSYTVTEIGRYAFKDCNDLEAVTLPSTIKKISQSFEGCTVLKKICVESILCWLDIEKEFFNGLYSPITLAVDGEDVVDLVIPSGVTSVPECAFKNISLNSVDLNDVENVGKYAFYECGLKRVEQSHLKKVENCGFFNNPGLSIVLEGIEYVGASGFDGCGVTDVTLWESLRYYGESAFNACTVRAKDFKQWCGIDFGCNPMSDNCEVFIGATKLNDLRALDLPEDVTEIGDHCFANCIFRSVDLNDNVTKIGAYAFSNCKYLRSVYIGPSIEDLGEYAFKDCDVLEELEMLSAGKVIRSGTFANCASLETIIIPEGVETIENYAFSVYTYGQVLNLVSIPSTLKEMPYDTFNGFKIQNIDIADIKSWCEGNYNFYDPNHWETNPNLLVKGELVTDLVIPEGVTNIQEHAFAGFSNIKTVTLPESIQKIGYGAFISDEIETFNLPVQTDYEIMGCCFNAKAWLDNQPDVIYINNKLYHVKYNVKELNILDGTTEILFGCMQLNLMARESCEVETITIPASVQKIANVAFNGLPQLKKVVFEGAYNNITNDFPQMAIGVFSMCDNLNEIYYNGNFSEKLPYMFNELFNGDIHFFVPNIYLNNFEENWDLYVSDYNKPKISFFPMNRNYNLKISEPGYSTLWLDFDALVPTGVEAYFAESFSKENSTLHLEKIEGNILPRETGVVLKGEANNYTFVESDTEGTEVESLLVGQATDGTFNDEGFNFYKLTYADSTHNPETFGFYLGNEDGSINATAYKAYLKLPKTSNANIIRIRFVDEDASGIEAVANDSFVNNSDCYNLSGQKVGADYKGIVVKNGRKMFVK